jgi:hypothetical protein
MSARDDYPDLARFVDEYEEKPHTWTEAKAALAEIDLLRAELFEEWEYNHYEHCGGPPPLHDDGSLCHWPPPPVLGLTADNYAQFEAMTADWKAPYLRRG